MISFAEELDRYYEKLLKDSDQILPISSQDLKEYNKAEKRLYDLRIELSSISHEKHVLQQLTKDVSYRYSQTGSDAKQYNRNRSKAEELKDLQTPISIPPYIPPYRHLLTKKPRINVLSRQDKATERNAGVTNTDLSVVPTSKQDEAVKAPKIKRKKTRTTTEPALDLKLSKTEQELNRLKQQLARTNSRLSREKSKSIEKLQFFAQAMEEKQLWKDEALLSAVDQLIEEAVLSFQDVVDETELIAIIEDILAQCPLPNTRAATRLSPIPEELEVNLSFRSEEKPVSYSVVSLPEKRGKREEIAVQTEAPVAEQSPEPAPAPREAAPPVVPQIIIQHPPLPPPPAPPTATVNYEEREKELMDLFRAVISGQEKTMQGQQALLLTVIQQQFQSLLPKPETAQSSNQDEDKVSEEATVEDQPLTRLTPPPPISPPPPAEEKLEEVVVETEVYSPEPVNPKVRYNTCFGEFLLSGKQLYGRYSVPEKLPFQHYLNQIPSASEPPSDTEPRLRRRASPLTMKLLCASNSATQNPSKVAQSTPPPDPTPSEQGFAHFATKLLDLVSEVRPPVDRVSQRDISKAVHEGIAQGIQQVMGYFPGHGEERRPHFPPSTEEVWQRKTARSTKQGKDRSDPLLPLTIHKEIKKSKASYQRLTERATDDSRGDGNSVEYNDSISLSEEFEAFNDEDDYNDRGERRRRKVPLMSRFLIDSDGEEGEEDSLVSPTEYEPAKKSEEHFASPRNPDDAISDLRESSPAASKAEKWEVDLVVNPSLPPLFSSVLPQQETLREIQQQRAPKLRVRSNDAGHHNSSDEERGFPRDRLSDDSDGSEALHSLELSHEQHKCRYQRRPPPAVSGSDSEDDDSDRDFHRDHRLVGRPQPLSPSDSLSGDSDKEALSIPTASSSDSFAVRRTSSPTRHHLSHQTRYSLSEIRSKRRDLLMSWNQRRKSERSTVILPGDAGEEEKGGLEVSLSSSPQPDERSYNSLLSSEESSIVSQRLRLLRKKNKDFFSRRRRALNTAGASSIPSPRLDDDETGSGGSQSFSVNTPLSQSSESLAGHPSSLLHNRLLLRPSSGTDPERGIKVSVPLLNIDSLQYAKKPKWKPS